MSWQVTGDALLIDLDGTLVDSHASIAAGWGAWARRYDVDLATVLDIMPGRNATSVMREVRPDLPESVLAQEYGRLLASEIADAGSVTAMPGARELLDSLPGDRWGLVTSSTRELAEARLKAAGLPVPEVLIGGEAVAVGKPDPAGYLAAAEWLGVAPDRSLVIEDAPAGVAAALAAGMTVIALPPAARSAAVNRAAVNRAAVNRAAVYVRTVSGLPQLRVSVSAADDRAVTITAADPA
jgi:mannitol-1-/sugar-/sorbitol-6-phosphatase